MALRLLKPAMLNGLSVRDIVLIERLDLELRDGLSVLTGETGAGKSILLDALGLALGVRGDAGLIRVGAKRGGVSASFELPPGHAVEALLREHGIQAEDPLVLRRVLRRDGRSRAWINDQPVGVALLRRVGDQLVEIHGQHDERGLLDAASHRAFLDAFGTVPGLREACAAAYDAWREARTRLTAHRDELAGALGDEDYLRHVLEELRALAPEAGEEAGLVAERALLREGERIVGALGEATGELNSEGGVDGRLRRAERALLRVAENAEGRFDAALEALARAATEAVEAIAQVEHLAHSLDLGPGRLEQVEERLFALREAARKHRVGVDDLAALTANFVDRLQRLEAGEAVLAELEAAVAAGRERFETTGRALSAAREDAAARLDARVMAELPSLRLDSARFRTGLEILPEARWSAEGMDRVAFEVATTPGAEPGDLSRVASGGELARFMLALKVALAGTGGAGTLVFDEVDRGVGGAVADRVGARLAELARATQVLVVTHSPQVAARGAHHWRISRQVHGTEERTNVEELAPEAREEEIARMLAGATVTAEARAAASSLITGAQA